MIIPKIGMAIFDAGTLLLPDDTKKTPKSIRERHHAEFVGHCGYDLEKVELTAI